MQAFMIGNPSLVAFEPTCRAYRSPTEQSAGVSYASSTEKIFAAAVWLSNQSLAARL